MNILNRVTLTIKRKPGKSIILFLIVFLLGVLSSGAILVRHAIYQTEANLRAQLPAVTTLQWELPEDLIKTGQFEGNTLVVEFPTTEMIERVGSLPYVRDYDFRSGSALFSQDLEMVHLSMIPGVIPDEIIQANPDIKAELDSSILRFRDLGGYVELFPVMGINNPHPPIFQTELLSLVSGRLMTQDELDNGASVAMVSTLFAEVNNLQIGSTFILESNVYNTELMMSEGISTPFHYWHVNDFVLAQQIAEFEVVGIFDVNEAMLHIDNETIYLMSHEITDLYNQVYTPHRFLEELERSLFSYRQQDQLAMAEESGYMVDTGTIEENPLELHATFVLYDSREYNAFYEAASNILPDGWQVADTSGAFAPIRNSMDTMLWISQLIYVGALVSTVIILSLVITLFLRDRKYEIGIYRTLGERKDKIISQILIEILTISIVAMIFALLAGHVFSSLISRQMLEQNLIRQEQEEPFIGFSEQIPRELFLFDPGPMSVSEMMDAYNISLDGWSILVFFGTGIVVILLSTVIPLIYVLRLEPKKILLQNQ